MMTSTPWRWYAIATACLLLLVTGAYYNGLQGPFLLDDVSNIQRSPTLALQDLSLANLRDVVFSSGALYPDRGLARLSFALNYYLAGGEFNVLAFKLTNLGIHLLNALMFWFVAHRLLARYAAMRGCNETIAGRPWWQWAAVLAAFFWVLHPLQLTAVLYIVQRMTSLSALFCLLGLGLWICGRERLESGARGALGLMCAGLILGLPLGFLSKENAVLLPYYLLITEAVFFSRDGLKPPALRVLRGFFLLFAVLPGVVALGVIVSHWESITAVYHTRSFSLDERLLSEARILWYYLQLLVYPDAHSLGFYHDDFILSRDLLTPLSTLAAVLGWLAVTLAAVAGLRRQRLFAFAVLWYLIGHSIESSFIALEPIFEHRNYLPIAGVILVLSVYVLRGLMAISDKPVLHLALPGLLLLTLSGVTFSRANIWQDKYTLVYIGVKNHPQSPRYHREFASVLSRTGAEPEDVFRHWQLAIAMIPGDVSSLFEMSRILNYRLLKAGIRHQQFADAMSAIDVLNDPLPEEVPALLAYNKAIDNEVKRRVREQVLIVNSSEIGRYTELCLNTGDILCERMQDMVAVWIKGVSENPYLNSISRAKSAVAYARIMAAGGDSQAAIKSVNEAIRLAPWTVNYRLDKAALYLAMKQPDAADKVLDEARQYLHWSGHSREVFDLLRNQIRTARERRTGP